MSAHVCSICNAAFEHDDPEVVAMRMRHHLGNHYATDPDGHPELAPFAPPYHPPSPDPARQDEEP